MSKINFEPTRDWLVLPLPDQKVTDAGIILDERTANAIRSNVLEVLAAGPDCKCKVGDTVYVHPGAEGLKLDIDGEMYVLVNESMAVLGRKLN